MFSWVLWHFGVCCFWAALWLTSRAQVSLTWRNQLYRTPPLRISSYTWQDNKELSRFTYCRTQPLTCIIQEFSQVTEFCNYYHYIVLEHIHHSPKNPVPASNHSHYQLCPSPDNHQSTFHHFGQNFCLFLTFHVSGIMQYRAFDSWLFFFSVVAWIPYYSYTTFYLFIH